MCLTDGPTESGFLSQTSRYDYSCQPRHGRGIASIGIASPDCPASLPEAVLAAHSAELRNRIAGNPDNPHLLHALGTVTFHQGGELEAFALWKAASVRQPNLAPAEIMRDVHKMFILLEKDDATGAEEILRAAEVRYARQPHFQLMRAEQAMRSGNLKAAGDAYRLAYELAPELYVTSLNLARYYDAAGQEADALPLYQVAAALSPERAEAWLFLGASQFRQKRTEAALESLRRARSIDPAAPLPEKRLAELSIEADDFSSARDWYRSALATDLEPEENRAIRAALGDVLLRLGLLDEARKEIETALQIQESPPLLFALATIDEAQGNPTAAEEGYRRVLELMPSNPLPANNLAMLLIRAGKSADEALRLAEQARRALPNNAFVESTFGCALSHSGQSAEAVEVLVPVVESAPGDAWAHYCLGSSLVLENRSKEAIVHLTKVSEIDPRFPLRRQLEDLLEKAQENLVKNSTQP